MMGNKDWDEGWKTGYKLGLERAQGIAESFAFTHGETCSLIAAAIERVAAEIGTEEREPPHRTGCICADCSGAELTADNDCPKCERAVPHEPL